MDERQIDSRFSCSKCKSTMKKPVRNSCGHHFCALCVYAIRECAADQNRAPRCSECNEFIDHEHEDTYLKDELDGIASIAQPGLSAKDSCLSESTEGGWSVGSKIALCVGVVVGATASVALAPVVIGAVGFTSAGVAAGSLAAGFQSAFLGGVIVKGSVFALLQSAGVLGLGAGSTVAVAAAGGTVGAAGAVGVKTAADSARSWSWFRKLKENQKKE